MRALLIPTVFTSAVIALPVDANAASVRFCFRYAVDYNDSGSHVGDDFLTGEPDAPAWGARVRVDKQIGGSWSIIHDAFTPWEYSPGTWPDPSASAKLPGCTPVLNLDDHSTYRIRVRSQASIRGNLVEVVTPSSLPYGFTGSATFTPSGNQTVTWTTTSKHHWNIAAVAGQTLRQFHAADTGDSYLIINDDYSSSRPGSAGWNRTEEAIYLPNGVTRKYVMAHEMGHAIGHFLNKGASPNHSYGADPENCWTYPADCSDPDPPRSCDPQATHQMNSKEYASAAAWEGWAHFVAAVAFNSLTEDDCRFRYYKAIILNHDPVTCATTPTPSECEPAVRTLDCSGSETPPMDAVSTEDYLGSMCNGPLGYHSTEYDWMRFWWRMATTQNVPLDYISAMWDYSNPETWISTRPPVGSPPSPDMPYPRLRSAAHLPWIDYGTEFDVEGTLNGIHR